MAAGLDAILNSNPGLKAIYMHAGGVFLALTCDRVWARAGAVLNPHYKGMGNLYGSEYWTYLLPRRVGQEKAREIMIKQSPLTYAGRARTPTLFIVGEIDRRVAELKATVRREVPHAEVAVLYDHADVTTTVAFTLDGGWLISGSRDKTVKLRRIPTFEETLAIMPSSQEKESLDSSFTAADSLRAKMRKSSGSSSRRL